MKPMTVVVRSTASAAPGAPVRGSGPPPAAPQLKAISCPACGGAAGNLAPGGVQECPYCDVPLMLVSPGNAGAAAIEPAVTYERARSIVEKFLSSPGSPPALKENAARRGIELTFVPWFDLLLVQASEDRPPVRSRMAATHMTAVALENEGREIGCDRIPVDRVRAAVANPYRAGDLAARAVVLDPQRSPESIHLPNIAGEPLVIERRVRTLYYPIWLARFSYGRSLYQCAVDGTTGEILRGVLPSHMRRRVVAGVAFTFLFSAILAFFIQSPSMILQLVLHSEASLFLLGGIVLVLAAAWDRLRFRREMIVEGESRRQVPINRPVETKLEMIGRRMISMAKRRQSTFEVRWGS